MKEADKIPQNSRDRRVIERDNVCVCCGESVPEGRTVCYICEHKNSDKSAHKPKKPTLCWECSKINCPWMLYGLPIKGWIAEPTKLFCKGRTIKSFNVTHCPQYEKSKR